MYVKREVVEEGGTGIAVPGWDGIFKDIEGECRKALGGEGGGGQGEEEEEEEEGEKFGGEGERRLERRLEQSDSKSIIPLSSITNNLPLVASSLRSSPLAHRRLGRRGDLHGNGTGKGEGGKGG